MASECHVQLHHVENRVGEKIRRKVQVSATASLVWYTDTCISSLVDKSNHRSLVQVSTKFYTALVFKL